MRPVGVWGAHYRLEGADVKRLARVCCTRHGDTRRHHHSLQRVHRLVGFEGLGPVSDEKSV